MDSSAACLMRLASAVHPQGYKVVLTGEGADEALAGYAWFKTQKIRDMLRRGSGRPFPRPSRSLVAGIDRRRPAHLPDRFADPGRSHRPARRLRLHGPGPVAPLLRAPCGTSSAVTRPTTTWASPTTGSAAGTR